jgi:hypothetical protein
VAVRQSATLLKQWEETSQHSSEHAVYAYSTLQERICTRADEACMRLQNYSAEYTHIERLFRESIESLQKEVQSISAAVPLLQKQCADEEKHLMLRLHHSHRDVERAITATTSSSNIYRQEDRRKQRKQLMGMAMRDI